MKYLNQNLFGASTMGNEELAAVENVIARRCLFRFGDDPARSECALLEAEIARSVNSPAALVTSNGTAALRAGLVAAGIGPGDIVGVSAFTFIATASAIATRGAYPLPVDLGEDLGVDLVDLEMKIDQMKMFIPVNVPGHSLDMVQVLKLARHRGVVVMEDACQALGVSFHGRAAGCHGDLGVFSFQQNKQIAAGEGGALVGTEEMVARARRYSDHGASRDSTGVPSWDASTASLGENLRMTELQAAVLRPQLARLPVLLEQQRVAREQIRPFVEEWPISIIASGYGAGDSGAYLAILCKTAPDARRLIAEAQRERVLLRYFWREPITKLPPLARYVHGGPTAAWWSAPRAESWAGRLLALPVPPGIEPGQLTELLGAIRRVRDSVVMR